MSELFTRAMQGIGEKVALQEIRKVIRGKDKESEKLDKIIGIVHAFEEDAEWAAEQAERREMEADEAQMRKERIDDMFENMVKPLDELSIHRKGDSK